MCYSKTWIWEKIVYFHIMKKNEMKMKKIVHESLCSLGIFYLLIFITMIKVLSGSVMEAISPTFLPNIMTDFSGTIL